MALGPVGGCEGPSRGDAPAALLSPPTGGCASPAGALPGELIKELNGPGGVCADKWEGLPPAPRGRAQLGTRGLRRLCQVSGLCLSVCRLLCPSVLLVLQISWVPRDFSSGFLLSLVGPRMDTGGLSPCGGGEHRPPERSHPALLGESLCLSSARPGPWLPWPV